ncbi:MAG: HTTM domain-containing protein, partial [Verrucomicrobiales bacterium]
MAGELAPMEQRPVGRPWRMLGTSMSPNLLLMCKLLFLLLALHSFHKKLGDPFLPFISGLDAFNLYPGLFCGALEIGFFLGGLCLLFNVQVRIAAVALGVTVLLAVVASKPGYRNHILISGCLFLLAGLQRRDEEPWMLSLQMAVIYFGAFVNKALAPDWWSGQFMHNWMHNDLSNRYYEFFSPWFPGNTLAAMASWGVIASELALTVLFLVRKWHHLAVFLTLAMHGS